MSYEQMLMSMMAHFPSLNARNSRLTSTRDYRYNCIAWAAEDTTRWWWPDALEQTFWPTGIPREATMGAFVRAFGSLGYSVVCDASLEPDRRKVAIYARQGYPRHAARQVASGWWTSKLGNDVDIEHELRAIEGPVYGEVAIILARPI